MLYRLLSLWLALATQDVEDATKTPIWTDVFVSGDESYHTYRIPSIVQTPKGTLLAFCEGRKGGRGDSGDIDLLVKRSEDGGQTWSERQTIWDDGPNTCGNPCPVLDRETGVLWLLMTHNLGQDHESRIIAGQSEGTRTVWVCSSEDDGVSWSAPEEITEKTKREDWTWYATGPGAGIQLERGPHKGRLVIPCDHIERETRGYYSHVIYSDDHGKTWQLGGRTPSPQVNECEVVELSDGRLLLNMRNYDRSKKARQISFSDDGGDTWSPIRHDEALVEPRCQASLRRIRWPHQGRPGLIAFCNPGHPDRRVKLTLRASLDDAETWPFSLELYPGGSAYSCLVALEDGAIGVLFEADDYRRIAFGRIDTVWLMKSKGRR